MRVVKNSILVRRPVEEVFAFATDARNNPLWQARSGLRLTRQEPDGLVGVGTRIAEVWKWMGRTIEATSEVTAYKPNRSYVRHALANSSPIKAAVFTFEPVVEGVRWSVAVHIQTSGLLVIAEPLLGNALKRRLVENMIQAKALLERRG